MPISVASWWMIRAVTRNVSLVIARDNGNTSLSDSMASQKYSLASSSILLATVVVAAMYTLHGQSRKQRRIVEGLGTAAFPLPGGF